MEQVVISRRKREYDFSRFMQEKDRKIHTQINWDTDEEEVELEEGYEEIEDDYEIDDEEMNDDAEGTALANASFENKGSNESNHSFMIDGKPFVPKQQPKKQNFMETHDRYTTYIDRNVLNILRMLQANHQIDSIAKCINDSLKEYLMTHYQQEK